MLVIQCDTSRFRPARNNGFKCNGCRQFIVFPERTTSVTIISYGTTHGADDGFTVVKDAPTGTVLHDCRTPASLDDTLSLAERFLPRNPPPTF